MYQKNLVIVILFVSLVIFGFIISYFLYIVPQKDLAKAEISNCLSLALKDYSDALELDKSADMLIFGSGMTLDSNKINQFRQLKKAQDVKYNQCFTNKSFWISNAEIEIIKLNSLQKISSQDDKFIYYSKKFAEQEQARQQAAIEDAQRKQTCQVFKTKQSNWTACTETKSKEQSKQGIAFYDWDKVMSECSKQTGYNPYNFSEAMMCAY